MAGVTVFTGLLFVSGALWLAWGATALLHAGKKAQSLILLSLVFFLVSFIVYAWLRTFGAGPPPANPQWVLMILGPGVSFLAFALTLMGALFAQLRSRDASFSAKGLAVLYSISVVTVLLLLYADWLARFYGWNTLSKFANTLLGSVILCGALALMAGVGIYNRHAGKQKRAQ